MDEVTAEFLEKLTSVYRNCDSYQDSGLIQSTLKVGENIIKKHSSFSTFYVRPGRLSLYLWLTEDQSGPAFSVVYLDGAIYAYREGSGAPAHKFESLSHPLGFIGASGPTDGFELAIPALLEKDLRDNCGSNFFDKDCSLVQQLNSKFHVRKRNAFSTVDVWFRSELSVHDVDIQASMTRDEMLELDRKARALPEVQKLTAAKESLNSDYLKMHEEYISDTSSKSRRVYSHVLFDQDIDESVFQFPT